MVRSILLALLISGVPLTVAASLWSSSPATYGSSDNDDYILKTGYALGNGKLGAIPFGPPGAETLMLNLDSLWYGGPFELTNYTGGNPTEPVYQYLPGIREWIFQNGTGNISELLNDIVGYGSYQTLGNLTVSFERAVDEYANYTRTLDLRTGIHRSGWTANGTRFETSVFCSYPAQSCVYNINSSGEALPALKVSLSNDLMSSTLVNSTCGPGYTRLDGITQASIGLHFTSIAQVVGNTSTSCSQDDGSLVIPALPSRYSITIVSSAESDYDQTKGNAQSNYSFRGQEPGPVVEQSTQSAAAQSYSTLLQDHIDDYTSLMGQFVLDLPDTANSSSLETADLVAHYTNSTSNPFLESLMFDYSRHLLISSSRTGSLPANLQGRWSEQLEPAWSADYHANINLQMNYWGAEQTGLGDLSLPLFAYMANTWAPRGSETAQLLYNGSGWVTHDEMNIFGYTGMKNAAQWANYPASAAWLMQHVFDHYDYSQNTTWLVETGYPLLKAIASFWLSQLQEDRFYNDGTLVVNPCNSPEQGPTTSGCTHYQQLIHQVLEAVLRTAPLVSEPASDFLASTTAALARLDTGVHIDPDSPQGVLKEWKVPDAYLYDVYPEHRHISHLVGWYPGYAIASFASGFTNTTLQDAVRASLLARGDGTDADGDGGNFGWPKVWRGACWARLNDSARAYGELQLSIANNVAPNLLSMYAGKSPPFQIDMNFGWAGNVLSMLVVDLPLAGGAEEETKVRTVVLGPAIPSAWGGGSVKGLRIRGGVVVNFAWDGTGIVTNYTLVSGEAAGLRLVNVRGENL
ncbi:family 95 glycoside hydrolase [Cryphonectria parasitica EP155]|uniref:Family 95 glycoside hydrolase n=1 Tax=Cryphonectria parasitica (strain ATCC 38755 / EP155) TaxID=660469 RepID=A0A9P4XYS7_CRYP1|nr:family 95 glycoside hydrolase [Cryphonectria parasitica EP155]KAF3763822.1 family 95 glycoside hydrolase [Cryphonectria parasitica EP155]